MENRVNLKYGKGCVEFTLPVKFVEIEHQSAKREKIDWEKKIEESFANPIASPGLGELIEQKRPDKIVIIVNDITRPVPYDLVLKPMLNQLKELGIPKQSITLLIATGMHRPMTAEEVEECLGQEIVADYCWENHYCEQEMEYIGELSEDVPFFVNPLVKKADLLCAVGVIAPHYMAGYSGGRKSLFPGVCGRETIEAHHALMRLPESKTANLNGNKFHQLTMEAAETIGLDFIANVVVDSKNEVIDLVVGDYKKAWEVGVTVCRESSAVSFDTFADLVIVSAGGFPKDINMYQAQKALENSSYCAKEGAPILLIAECGEGLGEDVFERWLKEAAGPASLGDRIKNNFELGGHKAFAIARVAEKHPIYLYSQLESELTRSSFMIPVTDLEQFMAEKVAESDLVYLLPHGANTVPVYNG